MIYMTALQRHAASSGGWPLSMFLTADGKPIFGGTYWPPEDKEIDGEKVRGFKTILKTVHDAYEGQAEGARGAGRQASPRRRRSALDRRCPRRRPGRRSTATWSTGAVEALKEEFDPVYGGFGSPARKLPRHRSSRCRRAWRSCCSTRPARRRPTKTATTWSHLTLDQMALGGIYDQLGGGFHRYSTERTWTVPHFEKMLYDNAQLVEVYADAYRATKKPLYKRVVERDAGLRRPRDDLAGRRLLLGARRRQHGEEGRFYVWTDEEIDDVLTDEADADACPSRSTAPTSKPNFEEKYHILLRRKPLADVPRS